MTKDDFTVMIIPVKLEKSKLTINNGGVRSLNVIAVDTSAKTITVKYGGAYSGTYDLLIKSKTNGNIDTSATPLKVVFEIKSFTPTSGSIFGGTKLTITGGPFIPDDLKETIVKVGYKWWEPINHYCYVEEVMETTVTCRLPLDLNREAKGYEVIAFASTYEESNCEFDKCLFTFTAADSLPEVTGVTSEFDVATNDYKIKVAGTGINETKDQIDFKLDNVKQTVLSASSTEVVIQVDSVLSGAVASKIELFFSVGIPKGYDTYLAGVTLTPKLLSLSTNTISLAGSTI